MFKPIFLRLDLLHEEPLPSQPQPLNTGKSSEKNQCECLDPDVIPVTYGPLSTHSSTLISTSFIMKLCLLGIDSTQLFRSLLGDIGTFPSRSFVKPDIFRIAAPGSSYLEWMNPKLACSGSRPPLVHEILAGRNTSQRRKQAGTLYILSVCLVLPPICACFSG